MSIQSINRAIAIMRCFSEADPELSVTELSQRLKLPKSTVSRILGTLQDEGLVGQNPRTGRYRLGVGLISMAGVALGRIDVRGAAFERLDDLAAETRETISVNILDDGECVTVDNKVSPQPLRYANWIGRRMPLHCTASGKVLLAGLSVNERDAFFLSPLRRHTPRTITDPKVLNQELHLIRERGYALGEEEYQEGFCAIAAPLFDHSGRVVGALAVSGPSFRLPHEVLMSFCEPLQQTAANISSQLGYVAPLNAGRAIPTGD